MKRILCSRVRPTRSIYAYVTRSHHGVYFTTPYYIRHDRVQLLLKSQCVLFDSIRLAFALEYYAHIWYNSHHVIARSELRSMSFHGTEDFSAEEPTVATLGRSGTFSSWIFGNWYKFECDVRIFTVRARPAGHRPATDRDGRIRDVNTPQSHARDSIVCVTLY